MFECVTLKQLKDRWRREASEIYIAIDNNDLPAYDENGRPIPKDRVIVNDLEAQMSNDVSMENAKSSANRRIASWHRSMSLRHRYVALSGCIFKLEDVMRLDSKYSCDGKKSKSRMITCNTLINNDLFNRCLEALSALYSHCLENYKKNDPVTREKGFEFLDVKFPELKTNMQELLWKNIPRKYKPKGRPKKEKN